MKNYKVIPILNLATTYINFWKLVRLFSLEEIQQPFHGGPLAFDLNLISLNLNQPKVHLGQFPHTRVFLYVQSLT